VGQVGDIDNLWAIGDRPCARAAVRYFSELNRLPVVVSLEEVEPLSAAWKISGTAPLSCCVTDTTARYMRVAAHVSPAHPARSIPLAKTGAESQKKDLMARPASELADLFRQHGEAYRQPNPLPLDQLWVIRALFNAAARKDASESGHSGRDHEQALIVWSIMVILRGTI
jgi:hypothetical protein